MSGVVLQGEPGRTLRVRLPADPSSVPAARRFVVDGLSATGQDEVADDAALCVSELASNATLHAASGFYEVALQSSSHTVRLSVADDGPLPRAVVVPSRRPARTSVDDEPATGRGLLIVSRLASSWGVDETPTGKVVWLVLDGSGDSRPTARTTSDPDVRHQVELPPSWHRVRLLDCPVALSLRQDQHLDELVRELQLIEGGHGPEPSNDLGHVIESMLGRQAHARHAGRRLAQDAAAQGLATIDIEMVVPAEAASDVRELDEVVREADGLCEKQELLTLAATPEVRALRSWMVHEFVQQIERGLPPTPWQEWRGQ
ncbi:MAG TPA: ATP-binding protein [Actinomycetales bacterium]|nr:ATP-binding protein [Actinomycetales bacterium]